MYLLPKGQTMRDVLDRDERLLGAKMPPFRKSDRLRIKLRDAQELHGRGFTPNEVAELMGVSQPTISRWLRGKTVG